MRLFEIENKLVPSIYIVDRKTRKVLGFYGYYDDTRPTTDKEWQKYQENLRNIRNIAEQEIRNEYPNDTVEIHYISTDPRKLQFTIGDRVDSKGNKLPDNKPQAKNFLEVVEELLKEYASEVLGADDPDETNFDVSHENFKTSSGIPVYFIEYDHEFFYVGLLPNNRTTPIVHIHGSGYGSIETVKPVNGFTYIIEFNDGRRMNKDVTPTLYKLKDEDRLDKSKWQVVAQNSDFEKLLGILLDILWNKIGKK